MKYASVAIGIAFFIRAAVSIGAQSEISEVPASTSVSPEIEIGMAGLRRNWTFVPTGFDVKIQIAGEGLVPGNEDILFFKIGGGYESIPITRNFETGDPLRVVDGKFDASYESPNFQWDFLYKLGIMNLGGEKNVEAFGGYRGRFDIAMTTGPETVFSDRNLIFNTAFVAGAALNAATTSPHMLKSGIVAEVSGEIGPAFANPIGKGDYWRATAKVAGFLPLFDVRPESRLNVLSVNAAGRFMMDYSDGASVPLFVCMSFGGRDLEESVGDEVRGYGSGQFDTQFKAVANAEIRVLGPAFFDIENLMPYFLCWVDAGFFSGYWGSQSNSGESGFVMAAGFAFGGTVLGVLEPSLGLAFPLLGDAPSSPRLKIKFKFHF